MINLQTGKSARLAGEVALPGGKREPKDRDDVHPALREAEEETGLDPQLVQARRPCSQYRRSRARVVGVRPVWEPVGAWHGWYSSGHAAIHARPEECYY